MDFLLNDVRFALRTLRKQPAFTATVIATLALAIGASTAIFSVVNSTLLRPLPFREPGRIAFLWGVAGPARAIRGGSFIEVQDWMRLNRAFETIAIYDETSLNLRTPSGADRIGAEMVSASYFTILGATPAIGRVFTAAEDQVPDANPVVVLSDAMWTTRFGRDPAIVGRTITLNDRPFTVLGVMRPGFKGLSFDTDLWFPAAMVRANGGPQNLADRGTRWLGAVGRLKPGITFEAAQRDADRVALQLAHDFPQSNKDRGVQLFSLRDSYLGSTRTLVLAVFAAVALLLMIACANVLGLQLVRAAGRRREFALRIAIGANRRRLVQQLTVEGLVLAGTSAIVGLVVAMWGLRALVAVTPPGLLPTYATPSIDVLAFLFAFVLSVGCGVIFGLFPALRGSRVDLTDSLKQGARGSSSGFGRGMRFGSQQILVIAETALALVMLIGAGLYVRSLQKQLDVPLGFDPRNELRARFVFPDRYSPEQRVQLLTELRTKLSAIPSVSSVTLGSDMPLAGGGGAAMVHVPDANQTLRYYRHSVDPGFFQAIGARLVAGRSLSSDDRTDSPAVVVINESMARRFFADQTPIGKTLELGGPNGPKVLVVGVVADIRQRDLTTALATTEPDIYFPVSQRAPTNVQLAMRSQLPSERLTASLRRELAALDASIPLFGVQSYEKLIGDQTASGRFASTVLAVFGAAALILTAVGLYGVLAFLVSQRSREIGIRMALGATHERVLTSIIGQGVRLVVVGAAVGLVVAALAVRWIATQLYGVSAHDPAVFVGVPATLIAVATLASWLPARRAARVDPQLALRSE